MQIGILKRCTLKIPEIGACLIGSNQEDCGLNGMNKEKSQKGGLRCDGSSSWRQL